MPMNMDLSLYQRLEMRMRLAPQIIQSIEILQLPTLELQQRINQEMLENPVLEMMEPGIEGAEDEERTDEERAVEERAAEAKDERTVDDSEFDKMQEMEERLREYSSQTPAARPQRGERDPKLEAMQNTAARSLTLQEHLTNQLSMLDLDPGTRRIAENIIYNLDDNGYLQYPMEELVGSMPPGTTAAQAERVLWVVQSLEPPGVGARDLKECLLLQIKDDPTPQSSLVGQIITRYLDDLRLNRFPKIVKETGYTLEEIREAAEFIYHLSPRPGAVFSTEQPQYVLPDVRVQQNEHGDYEVVMCDDYVPRLRVSGQYPHVMQSETSTAEEKDYIRQKLQAARWIIDAIEQRRNTLKRIMEEIVKHQREFFDKGIRFLKPLRMGVVAEAARVHVSTVSRAIANKYVDTPNGLHEIRFFFAGSAVHAAAEDDETAECRESVLALVRDLIEKEDKQKPLSDVALLDILKQRGIDVARRTVTKYRQLMNIPPRRQRMHY